LHKNLIYKKIGAVDNSKIKEIINQKIKLVIN